MNDKFFQWSIRELRYTALFLKNMGFSYHAFVSALTYDTGQKNADVEQFCLDNHINEIWKYEQTDS